MAKHNDIESLVQGFAKDHKDYKSKGYTEAELRQQFLDPFWRALGWDVGDTKHLGPMESEVIIEKNIETVGAGGISNRRPDYLFRLGGFPRFIVEAKKPAVDINEDKDAIFQAKRYAWNSTIPFAVLTNFDQFRLFDTTLKPIFNEPRRGLVKEFSLDYSDYTSQWDVLTSTFGRDSVADSSLERLLAKVKKIKPGKRIRTVDRMLFDLKGGEPVDKVFLDYLDTHRRHFAACIYRDNKAAFPEANTLHGAAKLTEAVQRIMDRLVFMRVIEDRGIVDYGTLRKMLQRIGDEGGEFYAALIATFRDFDTKYNGYLYKPHSLSEGLKVDGSVLADFTRLLYPPDGPWDFAAIGDDILGIVYERFLGNVVTVKNRQAIIEEKPEVRHAGGVYYTPRFVVDSIIRRVVKPKIAGKTPAQILDVKILDPACGSGTFLVAALQYLFDYCLSAVEADPSLAKAHVPALSEGSGRKGRKKKSEIAFQDKEGRWYLAPDFRAALLTHCIHGVDIDQQAVEVTVMSLYLKMLESKLPENWATLWVERQLLPSLDNNVHCGNSLIDEADWFAYCEKTKATLFEEDKEIAFRINRFDWKSRTRGFGRLLDSQATEERGRTGFDCIIGNPPYIRVQELKKWAPEECEFYKWKYKSAAKGNYDIYVVFAEKALSLLAPDGLMGFIMPHKFWQAKYGEGLRKVITDGKHLHAVVDFGDQQVFKGASTYTAIHILSRQINSESIDYAKIVELEDGRSQCSDIDAGKSAKGMRRFKARQSHGFGPWVFRNAVDTQAMERLLSATSMRLGGVSNRMAQGIRTSMNPVYVLTRSGKYSNRFMSEHLGREVELDPDLLLTFLGAKRMRRYEIEPTSQVVVVPYYTSGDSACDLIPVSELQREYPATWDYLKQCEKSLRARERGKMNHDKWYSYVYPKNLSVMGSAKILVPDIVENPTFSLDADGSFAFVSGYAITLEPEYAALTHFILGLLNSKMLGVFLKGVSTTLRGGWYRPFPQFMRQIPIKLPSTHAEKKLAEQISESVRIIIDAKLALRASTLSDGEKRRLDSSIEAHENRIDETVFTLYGVDGLPS